MSAGTDRTLGTEWPTENKAIEREIAARLDAAVGEFDEISNKLTELAASGDYDADTAAELYRGAGIVDGPGYAFVSWAEWLRSPAAGASPQDETPAALVARVEAEAERELAAAYEALDEAMEQQQ